jgi:hypothetical protein
MTLYTYSVKKGSAVVEFLLEGDALSLRDRELTSAVIELALGLFQGAFQVLLSKKAHF